MSGTEEAGRLLCLAYSEVQGARSGEDWRKALRYADEAFRVAESHSLHKAVALYYLANITENMGRTKEAATFASATLKASKNLPAFDSYLPYLYSTLGRIHYLNGNYPHSISFWRLALRLFRLYGNRSEVERVQVSLAWGYGKAGRTREGWEALPNTVSPDHSALWHGACGILLRDEGLKEEAQVAGNLALSGPRGVHHYADAAEVALMLATLDSTKATHLLEEAANLFTRQAWDAKAILTLSLRERGGEHFEVDAASRGSGDPHDACSYTTGVA